MKSCTRGETGLNSEYNKEKFGFIAKEQGRDQWMENYQEETQGEGEDSGKTI